MLRLCYGSTCSPQVRPLTSHTQETRLVKPVQECQRLHFININTAVEQLLQVVEGCLQQHACTRLYAPDCLLSPSSQASAGKGACIGAGVPAATLYEHQHSCGAASGGRAAPAAGRPAPHSAWLSGWRASAPQTSTLWQVRGAAVGDLGLARLYYSCVIPSCVLGLPAVLVTCCCRSCGQAWAH